MNVSLAEKMDPLGGSTSGTSDLRVYQAWKASNVFFLQGRFIFGPDVRSLGLTIFLIVAPVVVFCIYIARKLMNEFSDQFGILIMIVIVVFTVYDIFLLLLTSGRDPGIIPRNAHPPEPEGYDGSTECGAGQTPQLRLPRTKEVEVNGVIVKIKYCDTCMLYRLPRCSHCSICNNCVERFDHHCPWVGQCIGLRNYRFFFMFVFSTTLLCIYVFAFCWVYVRRIMNAEETTIWRALIKTPASIALIIYTFIAMWFVGGLTAFHLYLISTNQTTYENFRYRCVMQYNPYNKGVFNNFLEIFFTSIPPSKHNFRAKMPREPVIPARSVRGGFMSPNMVKGVDDIEMGRKTVWSDTDAETDHFDRQLKERVNVKDGELADLSSDMRSAMDDIGERGGIHFRRSSWGRESGNWDISPDILAMEARVGEPNNAVGSSGSVNTDTQKR